MYLRTSQVRCESRGWECAPWELALGCTMASSGCADVE